MTSKLAVLILAIFLILLAPLLFQTFWNHAAKLYWAAAPVLSFWDSVCSLGIVWSLSAFRTAGKSK